MNAFQDILVFVVMAPGVIFGVFGLLWMMDWVPSERLLSWITGLTFAVCTFGVAALVWKIGLLCWPYKPKRSKLMARGSRCLP